MVENSPRTPACPPSDVSAGVGLAGLAGLMAWLMVCRHWAGLADLLNIPGPRAPLAGPYAALATVLFSGLPMVLWSVMVDKVHRDPATGIDWSRRRRFADVVQVSAVKLIGLWLTWALIGAAYCIARWYWVMPYRFAMQVLGAALVPMVVLSVPYVLWLDRRLLEPRDMAWHFGAFVLGRPGADRAEVARHLRAWTVKGFFTAFMISILPGGFERIVTLDWRGVIGDPIHTSFWLCEAMFLVDVQIAMVGYLVTFKPLAAQIRSAQPRLAGWVAALICYPPFILMNGGGPLDYHGSTADWAFWMEGHTALLWGWGLLLAVLTGIYAWATLAFGLRFSNLTWRGTLTNGPYRFTRHPAYLAKNLFWWASTLPLLVTSHNPVDAVRNTVILAGVSAVYYWRARTEETHLSAEDPKYRAYSAWMLEHGLITAPLHRLAKALARRHQPHTLQPAE
jgi:protein-S-isoprenylcysteine O-methyltransferase Ste14